MGRSRICPSIYLQVSCPKLLKKCQWNFILGFYDFHLILVCTVYIKFKLNFNDFVKNGSSYEKLIRNIKYRAHYNLQLLFEAFFILWIFTEIQAEIISDSVPCDICNAYRLCNNRFVSAVIEDEGLWDIQSNKTTF